MHMNIYPITIRTDSPASIRFALRVSKVKIAAEAIDHVVAHIEAVSQAQAFHKILSILGAF